MTYLSLWNQKISLSSKINFLTASNSYWKHRISRFSHSVLFWPLSPPPGTYTLVFILLACNVCGFARQICERTLWFWNNTCFFNLTVHEAKPRAVRKDIVGMRAKYNREGEISRITPHPYLYYIAYRSVNRISNALYLIACVYVYHILAINLFRFVSGAASTYL